jgi:type IV pilus assembly protein PilV
MHAQGLERRRPHPRGQRGTTLLEAMVALAILAVGLLGMMKLQIIGITSNAGARAHTTAAQLATELAGSLEGLPFDDNRLAGTLSDTRPTPFGSLLDADTTAEEIRVWSDDEAVPGARLDSTIEADPLDGSQPLYRRRWTVWDYVGAGSASGAAATKIIAVSVVYHERGNASPREVVVLTQRSNPGLALSFAAAYR